MGLRRILDFCEKYPVAFSIASQATCFVSGRTGTLKDEYFSVYVCENSTGSINFHYKSQDKKNKRSLRHQRNRKTVQCDQLRKNANCFKCEFHGICAQGTARISSWLQYALKTQRELQVDIPVNRVQFHNAFNNRASGYGDLDDCLWPMKDDKVCISVANKEFSFTDQHNMGVRHLEIDLLNCFGKTRMSHGTDGNFKIGRSPCMGQGVNRGNE